MLPVDHSTLVAGSPIMRPEIKKHFRQHKRPVNTN